ncbi:MAG: hypothetical protein AAF236_08195, partial [Verrucomicrobiota bacterium]
MKHLLTLAFLAAAPFGLLADDLITESFDVPEDFIELSEAITGDLPDYATTKERLEALGIEFSSGAAALYNPSSDRLIVTNSPEQIREIEYVISRLGGSSDDVVRVRISEAVVPRKAIEESEAKWAKDMIALLRRNENA